MTDDRQVFRAVTGVNRAKQVITHCFALVVDMHLPHAHSLLCYVYNSQLRQIGNPARHLAASRCFAPRSQGRHAYNIRVETSHLTSVTKAMQLHLVYPLNIIITISAARGPQQSKDEIGVETCFVLP